MTLQERFTEPVPVWRVLWFAVLALGVGGFTGFAYGRLHALEEVTSTVAVVTRTKEVQVVKWRGSGTTTSRTVSTPVVLQTPDGGTVVAAVTTTETARTWSKEGSSEKATDASNSSTSTTTTKSRPDWRIGIWVGATWKEPALRLGEGNPLVLGGTVERRIIGPFSMGIWGTTQGAFGGSISGEF